MITIIANSQISFDSMGGSDKILMELAKSWIKSGQEVEIWGCNEVGAMCGRAGLKDIFTKVSNFDVGRFGLGWSYVLRTITGFLTVRKAKSGIFYSSSDFFPDLFFGLKQKLLNGHLLWLCGLYLIAPYPWKSKYSNNLRGWLYFISQRLAIYLMKLWADLILVLAEEDKRVLISLGIKGDRVLVIDGGVDMELIESVPDQKIKYDGVFLGRFHPQKGLDQLVAAWKAVVKHLPKSQLGIIGWGDDEAVLKMRQLVVDNNLGSNISFLGFLDNFDKYKVLKSSRVFVFPSLYESWGIVVAEALACGLPVVAFDMPVTRRFGQGVTLIKYGNSKLMGKSIVKLLRAKNKEIIKRTFSWEKSAKDILDKLLLIGTSHNNTGT